MLCWLQSRLLLAVPLRRAAYATWDTRCAQCRDRKRVFAWLSNLCKSILLSQCKHFHRDSFGVLSSLCAMYVPAPPGDAHDGGEGESSREWRYVSRHQLLEFEKRNMPGNVFLWIFQGCRRRSSFQTGTPRGRKLLNTIMWHCIEIRFYRYRVIYRSVRLSLCWRRSVPKMCTLFCRFHIKKCSYLTSFVFGFVFFNASSDLISLFSIFLSMS